MLLESHETALDAGEILFLFAYARGAGDGEARETALAALDLPTDGTLCDNALLAMAHLDAYAQTGRRKYRDAACHLLDTALEDFSLPGGGFAGGGTETALTGENGAVIAALSKAGRLLEADRYLTAARNARLFVKTRLTAPDGHLWREWRERTPSGEAKPEDYGLYCWALAELYASDFSPAYLREAVHLLEELAGRFQDADSGAVRVALAKLSGIMGGGLFFRPLEDPRQGLEDSWDRGLRLLAMAEESYPRRKCVCASSAGIPSPLAGMGEAHHLAIVVKTRENCRALAHLIPDTRQYPIPHEGEAYYFPGASGAFGGAPVRTLEEVRSRLRALDAAAPRRMPQNGRNLIGAMHTARRRRSAAWELEQR